MWGVWLLLSIACLWQGGHCKSRLGNVGGGYPPPRTLGQVWPLPQQIVQHPTYLTIDSQTFDFVYQGIGCTVIDAAIARYKILIFNPPNYATCFGSKRSMDPANLSAALPNIQIVLTGGCETRPYFRMDESYTLKIDSTDLPGAAELKANSTWGILRGLETFSHCVYHDDARNFYANSTDIIDFPRFPFRGVMMDSSRHYVPVTTIKKHLDAMSYNKFNAFHWRMADDESFPYESQLFPQMSIEGAYNSKTHIYTFSDITSVINYASDRGIRVIPEFDSPAHSRAWGLGIPGLLTPCYSGGLADGTFGPMDPTKNSTFDFLTQFLGEAARLYTDEYFIVGGDEVDYTCWASNPNVVQFMQQMGFGSNYDLLYCYYINRVVDIISTIADSKTQILWQETVDRNCQPKANTLVDVWNTVDELGVVTAKGYQAIMSGCWALDNIVYGSDWINIYNCEPLAFVGTQAQYDLVQGGTASMFGQYDDATNIINKSWPRGSAAAERMWSDRSVNDSSVAAPRLEEHRCRMMERNINAAPHNGASWCPADYLVIS